MNEQAKTPKLGHALTEKEQRFCAEYSATANGAESARRAGYSDTGGGARVTATKLLKKPAVRALVDRLIAERAERTELEADQIIADLQRLARWGMLPVPVLDRAGRPTGVEKPLDGPLATKCLELLGKSMSLWTDRTEQIIDQNVEIVWRSPMSGEIESFEAAPAVEGTIALRVPDMSAVGDPEADAQEDEPSPPSDCRPKVGDAVVI